MVGPRNDKTDTKKQALIALKQFQLSDVAGAWPYLAKDQIIREIRYRLHNPFNVNQGQQPFCGPASILFELIRKFPLRYVELCRELFETGGFQTQTRRIQTSSSLREASQGDLRMGPADWMVLAALRRSQ